MKIKKLDFPPIQTLPIYTKPFSTHKTSLKNTKLDQALRILHLLSPHKTPLVPNNRQNHLRIIQDSFQFTKQHVVRNNADHHDVLNIVPTNMFDEMSNRHHLSESARLLSRALSSCASAHDLRHGIQLHCLAVKSGFLINAYIGTTLINLYSRCRKLGHAYKVFDEMPVKNVVSWTAIISGCAHDWKVHACLNLYHRMRNSGMIPNDYTYASVLSACTGFAALGQGRSMHCQTIRMGFESYLHISNALVSMYCKCGNLVDSFLIFENIQSKDIISWNSIIVGCSIHGLAMQSLKLFEKMKHEKFKPDAITFLGVLSSCRHAGLVEKGKLYFNSMLENGVKPELDHYSCMVDLLGRAGLIDEARDFIKKMPITPNAVVWGSLLSSCRVRGEVWHGIFAAESQLVMEPESASTHVQLANLYASVGCWDQAARLRKVMKNRGLKTNIGYSWIEIKNEVSIAGYIDQADMQNMSEKGKFVVGGSILVGTATIIIPYVIFTVGDFNPIDIIPYAFLMVTSAMTVTGGAMQRLSDDNKIQVNPEETVLALSDTSEGKASIVSNRDWRINRRRLTQIHLLFMVICASTIRSILSTYKFQTTSA